MEMNKNADYGNWVPAAMLKMMWTVTGTMIDKSNVCCL